MNKRILYVLVATITSIFVGCIGFIMFYLTEGRKFTIAYATFTYAMLITTLFLSSEKITKK